MKKLSVILIVAVLCGACSKEGDSPSPYADVFDEYIYQDIGYDEIVNKESEYIIVVGDLQYCTTQSVNIESLRIVIDWIRSQIAHGVNIKGVLQVGDMTQNNTISEWRIFNSHTLQLRKDIPTFMCIGNHDYRSFLGVNITDRLSTKYNDFIDYDNEAALLVTAMEHGKSENVLLSLEVNGETIYILSLEYSPRFGVTEWAKRITTQYSDKPMILLTHDYLAGSGELSNDMDNDWLLHNDQGIGLWQKLVKTNDNIRTVICGHNTFVAKRISNNNAGSEVTQIMFNSQNMPRGGDGWIQIWELDHDEQGVINVLTYNIFRKEVRAGDNSAFSFRYK